MCREETGIKVQDGCWSRDDIDDIDSDDNNVCLQHTMMKMMLIMLIVGPVQYLVKSSEVLIQIKVSAFTCKWKLSE